MSQHCSEWIRQQWQRRSLFSMALLPFSWLFLLIITVRRFYYRFFWQDQSAANIPVIVVGNIVVGGSGKTPLLLALVQLLQKQGYRPAIVSRGYGGDYQGILSVDNTTEVSNCGDEAKLLQQETNCPVMLAQNRSEAVKALIEHHSPDIIFSDDGLQHYAMSRTVELAVEDAIYGLGNQWLLPAGPLREPVKRLALVDMRIYKGVSSAGNYYFELQAKTFRHLASGREEGLDYFSHQSVHAVTAIGQPSSFFDNLRPLVANIDCCSYADHYFFKKEDLIFADNHAVIITSKDAVKCQQSVHDNLWVLQTETKLSVSLQKDFLALINKIVKVNSAHAEKTT